MARADPAHSVSRQARGTDDTEVTAYYTALPVPYLPTGNTSISIGYLGELYIDFGVGGALLAVFLLGLIFGRCYRAIRDYPRTPAFVNYGLCMMFALAFTSFGTALIKLIGGLVTVRPLHFVLQRYRLACPTLPGICEVSGRRSFGRAARREQSAACSSLVWNDRASSRRARRRGSWARRWRTFLFRAATMQSACGSRRSADASFGRYKCRITTRHVQSGR